MTGNDLAKLPQIFDLVRTMRCVRQNLFWAFFQNPLGITLAVTGVRHPIFAAAAGRFSPRSVLGNA